MPTFVLIAMNVAMYVYTSILSGNFVSTSPDVTAVYGQVNGLILYYGYYWQLFTAMFVHANIVHLAGNIMFFLIFGLRAEEIFDLKEYLAVYFLSGLAGNIATLAYGPYMISVGASGAIFGVFGACTIYLRRIFRQPVIGALMSAFLLLILNSVSVNVNILAHLGGLIIGLLLGYIFAVSRQPITPSHGFTYTYSTHG
jgi:rhomboid protease GluP